jgi:hypothetical protein
MAGRNYKHINLSRVGAEMTLLRLFLSTILKLSLATNIFVPRTGAREQKRLGCLSGNDNMPKRRDGR